MQTHTLQNLIYQAQYPAYPLKQQPLTSCVAGVHALQLPAPMAGAPQADPRCPICLLYLLYQRIACFTYVLYLLALLAYYLLLRLAFARALHA